MGINIAEIISLPDKNGTIPMVDLLIQLTETNDHESKVKYQFIKRALELLALVPKDNLPGPKEYISGDFEIDVDGETYKNQLKYVGYLHKEPIYELRISLKPFDWYFRATFFPKYQNGQLYYCFVFPFEKDINSTYDPTDFFKEETYSVFQNLRQNPSVYADYFEQ